MRHNESNYDRDKRVDQQIGAMKTGELITPKSMEREEVQRILVAAAYHLTMQSNQMRKGSITNAMLKQINEQLRTQPFEVLEKRLLAVQVQNPGVLILAMRSAGYQVDVGKDGSVTVNPEPDQFGGMGRPITVEEFERL